MNAPRTPPVPDTVKRRIYDALANDPMVTGHWTVHHAPEEKRKGPFTVDDTGDADA